MCEKCDKISDPKKVEDLIEEAKSSLASLNEGKQQFKLHFFLTIDHMLMYS